MSSAQVGAVLRYLRKLAVAKSDEQLPDQQLLERFTSHRDEFAYATLLKRHGPMVLSVCRGVLHNPHDAEDAFQATFVVLAQKAGSIHRREAVSSWLYRVAYHLAVKARASAARRRVQEGKAVTMPADDPLLDMNLRELRAVLYEELQRLPEKYRAPLVLCYLEEHTQEEAARLLGWSKGAVKGRLERGRDQLRARLLKRGLELSMGLFVTALAQKSTAATVSPVLTDSTLKAGVLVSAGKPAAAGMISPEAAALVKEATKAMFITKVKTVTMLLLAASLVAAGAGVLAQRGPPTPQTAQSQSDSSNDKRVNPPKLVADKQIRTDRHGDPLPAGALARLGTVRLRQDPILYTLAFSPDGKTLASGGGVGTIRLWDAATGKHLRQIEGHTWWVMAVAFSPDGKTLVSGGADGTPLRLWDAGIGKEMRQFSGVPGIVRSVAFSPDGRTVVSAGGDNTLRLWEMATGQEVRRLKGHEGETYSVAFSPDGKKLVSGGLDKTLRLWETDSGKEIRRFTGHQYGVTAVAFSPDGNTLASTSYDKTVLWQAMTGKEIRRLGRGQEWALAFSPDGKTLATGGKGTAVRLWEVASGKELRSLEGHPGGVLALAFAPDGHTLAVGNSGAIRLWDVGTGKEVLPSVGHQGGVNAVAFAPDGRTLATGSWDHTIGLWELPAGHQRRRLKGHSDAVKAVAFSPDGKTLASAAQDHTVRLWDVATGRELQRCLGHDNVVFSVAFSPDGRIVASTGDVVRLWDTATGKEVRQLRHSGTPVYCVAFSPDGKTLASGSLDQMVIIWDVSTGKEMRRLEGHQGWVFAVAFSPDGRLVASGDGGDDPTIRLWEVASGTEVRKFPVPPRGTYCISFSADGKTLASTGAGAMVSTSTNQIVHLWEVANGQERGRFRGNGYAISAVAFSPDSTILASGSQDSTAVIWDLTGFMHDGQLSKVRLTPEKLKTRWAELAGVDAAQAWRAIWTLVASPEQTVPFLHEQLQPATALDAQRIARLIAELDSDRFAVREKAEGELERLGEEAEPALRKALAGRSSAEVGRRVRKLLGRLASGLSPDLLRAVRAVEVLEHIGTPEAQDVLKSLAQGAPQARLTQEAKASLERLARRPVATP